MFWRRRRQRTDLRTVTPRETSARLEALFETSLGSFTAWLRYDLAPHTCQSFIDLAEGAIHWEHPRTGILQHGQPFYDGLKFHRVVEDFALQTGCPRGDGRGGPGWEIADEFHRTLRHSGPGILSMANSGPDTNGSQFFVTLSKQRHLDKKHTVFGEVVRGLDVVYEIGAVETDVHDRPTVPVTLYRVRIDRYSSFTR